MPMIEIDENEVVGMKQVSATVQAMLANPKARRLLLQAQKTIKPDAVIPEIDAAQPVLDEVNKLREELTAARKEREDDKTRDADARKLAELHGKWEKAREGLRADGYTDEGISALEKFMAERGIADHEIAVPAFEKTNPPPAPVNSMSNSFDVLSPGAREDDTLKLLFAGNDAGFLAKAVPEALKAVRRR